ncbi:Mo-dependent nitrogenase C-terminal domain-containing protein [Crocosphaera sp. UHCC 0190]|uniref:Mo-dependent nitrogenase C-terminal domain-containing protein n=1 Tax=Crocosphaera sp. UHCC 0190 TaxID=3110246 RepID=UPI002B2184F2|nr:Mo-dependent nitrogenase C-terminal domain-containing protein [Crocosphaera sp. UHCC 0190]MEA5508200.1 Mo-dependent nitrogenase C-terminal domain-containing protein [Crocosphaera sp. UHCC 0190]
MIHPTPYSTKPKVFIDPLFPLRNWINNLEVASRKAAHLICQVIPCCCPFERDITIMGRTLFHVPALCKLNPLYDEFVMLRLKALSYLTDICNEDVTHYIC